MNGIFTLTNAIISKGYQDAPAIAVREGEKDGKAWIIANLTVGVKNTRKGADGKAEYTNYHIEASGGNAKFLRDYAEAGTRLNIQGEMYDDHYEKDGEKKTIKKFRVVNVEIASGGKNKEKQEEKPNEAAQPDGFMSIPEGAEEELPFA